MIRSVPRPPAVARRGSRRPARLAVQALEAREVPAATLVASSFFDGAIYTFNANTGALTGTLAAAYSGAGGVSGPAGVTVGPDGNLYISSQSNDTVVRYDFQSGTFSTFLPATVLTPIATAVGAPVFAPSGLRFGPDGDLYVSLNGGQNSQTGRVVRFDVTSGAGGLTYAGTFTTFGTNLLQPTGLTFGTGADADTLYVSNLGLDAQFIVLGQVSKVTDAPHATTTTAAGDFVTPGSGGLNFASGLVWGPGGDLFVVDLGATSNVGQVLEFNPDGSFDHVFTTPGSLAFQFPSDAAFDAQGRLIVADLGPAFPPNLGGSIVRFRADGSVDGGLVSSADFPNTGPGTSGISPSELALIPNQAPTVSLPAGGAAYTEGQPGVVLDATATVADPDNQTFDAGTLTVSITANGSADDVLEVRDQGTGAGQIGVSGTAVTFGGTVIGTFTGGTGQADLVVSLDSNSTPAAVQALIRGITFRVNSQNPSADTRTIQVVLADGDGGTSAAATTTVTVTPVDNPPAVTTNTGQPAPIGGSIALDPAHLSATDPDNAADQLTFTVTTAPAHGTLLLGGNPVNTFTQADIDAGQLVYHNTGGPGSADSFSFTVSDGTLTTAAATFNLTLDAVPAVTTNAGQTVPLGATAILDASRLTATDADNTAAQLTYTVSAGPSHGTLLVGGNPVTSFTQADLNAGLVGYQNDGTAAATDSFDFTVSDGAFASGPATFDLSVDAVPAVVTNAGLTVDQGSTAAIGAGSLAASDADNPADQLTFTVTTGPAHGTLLLNGTPTTTFTQADVNAGLVSYQNDGSRLTSDSFTVTVSDGTFASGPATVHVAVNTVPAVTTAPADATAFAGTLVTFTAAADGSPAPSVQWQVSTDGGATFTDVAGATSATLTFKVGVTQDGNLFRAVFTNVAGSATSAAARLTVTPGLVITTDPVSQTIPVGTVATFTAAATGTKKPHVQWQVSTDGGATFANIPGAVGLKYRVKALATADDNLYRAVFSNAAGTAATAAAGLNVDFRLTVSGVGRKLVVPVGTPVTLTGSLRGLVAPTVQWEVSTDRGKHYAPVAGATSPTLAFAAQAAGNGEYLRAAFTENGKTRRTAPVILVVGDPPAVTTAPVDASVAAGQTATFSVAVAGTPVVRVQWQVSTDGGKTFVNVPGATRPTLTLPRVKAALSGHLYRAVLTSPFDQVATTAATLTVT